MKRIFVVLCYLSILSSNVLAQELPVPQWHQQPMTSGANAAGGSSSADLRIDKARRPVDPSSRELVSDVLSEAVILHNLKLRYVLVEPRPRVPCVTSSGATGRAAAAEVYLEGIYGHEQVLLLGARGTGIDGAGISNSGTRGAGFLAATLYYIVVLERTDAAGVCAGVVMPMEDKIVRFTDGTWYAPAWRRSLVGK